MPLTTKWSRPPFNLPVGSSGELSGPRLGVAIGGQPLSYAHSSHTSPSSLRARSSSL